VKENEGITYAQLEHKFCVTILAITYFSNSCYYIEGKHGYDQLLLTKKANPMPLR